MKLTNFFHLLAGCHTFVAASPHWPGRVAAKAVYFLRVDPAGSTVEAIALSSNGLLTFHTSSTSTGGIGSQSTNATSGQPTVIDPLQGQQGVSVGNNYLFTVNSGSNTAVMFKINPSNPLELTMVGSPVPTLGKFAMSIAYSSKYKKACVLNGGNINGVTCYSVSSTSGLIPDGVGLRQFKFSSTTPPILGGPKGSGSDIQFSVDSSKVIVTFKGNNKPATLGHVAVFDVDSSGTVASTFIDNRMQPLGIPFGFALGGTEPNNIFISDAAFGGVLATLNPSTNTISIDSVVNSTAFAASCWAVWSRATNRFYNINAGSPNVGVISSAGELVRTFSYDSALGGATDAVAVGPMLYFLTAVNEIGVVNTKTGGLVQQYPYADASDRPFWTGMASWPAGPVLSGGL